MRRCGMLASNPQEQSEAAPFSSALKHFPQNTRTRISGLNHQGASRNSAEPHLSFLPLGAGSGLRSPLTNPQPFCDPFQSHRRSTPHRRAIFTFSLSPCASVWDGPFPGLRAPAPDQTRLRPAFCAVNLRLSAAHPQEGDGIIEVRVTSNNPNTPSSASNKTQSPRRLVL